MLRLLLVVLLLASPLLAQGKAPSKPLAEARQKACAALAEMRQAMTKKGMKGEAEDCDAIAAEILTLDERPLCFVARESLKRNTKYTIEVTGQGGFRFTSTFTTQ